MSEWVTRVRLNHLMLLPMLNHQFMSIYNCVDILT